MASLLYGLAGKLAGELCSPLFKDYVGKPWELGTKAEFEKLTDTVSAIEAVLLDAEEKERTNLQVQDWLIKIKLVFYDLEDLLQEIRTKALKRRVKIKNKKAKKVHIFFSCSNHVKYRFKMGRKVMLIRERLDAIASDRNAFNFTERREEIHGVRVKKREETHSFVPIDQFIGRDADKEFIKNHLLQSDVVDNVSMISIVGIGGMGKTTLAQSIYDSDEVKNNFDLRTWVCVSNPFDVKLICENIIESAMKNKCKRLQMDVVKEQLKNIIDGKKYLLVLDDVWNESPFEWMKLESLLQGGARGSKILITARAELVARAANSIATHVLKGLSTEGSWELFKQVAFKRRVEQARPTIETIGKEIVKKCVGVPFVVKTIGSMLALKYDETDWLDFKVNDLPLVTQDNEGTIMPVLKMSYDFLSAPMKRCFVYCAIYPKDCRIKKEKLIGMWMAHGLIQLDDTTRSLEDVGERHFKSLLDRSFFNVHERDVDGVITCYKMHDLIHDLAQSVGDDEYYKPPSGANNINKSARHAWISGDELTNLCHGEKLRTLVLTESCDESLVNEVVSTFVQLRVLRLEFLSLTRVPLFLGGLRHLNYLNLSANTFDSLPESICNLYNLQTLILYCCWNLRELPTGTRELVSLRCLDVNGCDKLSHMPQGLEELTYLQTLSKFVTGRWKKGKRNCAEVCELKSLINLKGSLAITNLRRSKCAQCERNKSLILIELKLIKQLELGWSQENVGLEDDDYDEGELLLFESLKPHPNLEKLIIRDYGGKKFPSWMDKVHIGVSLRNIVYIKLEYCEKFRRLPPLGLLPSLQDLHLWNMDGVKNLIDTQSNEKPDQILFPSLKQLSLRGMRKLTRLVEATSSSTNKINFPVLEKLNIVKCDLFLADGSKEAEKQFPSLLEICFSGNTETLPAWPQYLPNLQKLVLDSCHKIASLPKWMGNLTSLQELYLEYLDSLTSVPDCMRRLTSLQRLLVVGHLMLVSRREKEIGVDWHNIANWYVDVP